VQEMELDDHALLRRKLVLEHVDGVSLATLSRAAVESGELMPVSIASRVMCDALAGLHAAHEARSIRGASLGIVHRDVSPQNVLVGADGVSRLIDFGIAKGEGREGVTTGAVLKGKVGYFAPEQLQGLEVDRRVDVFAAGIVLHELLVGRRLFRGEDHATVMMRVLIDEIPEVRSVRSDAPPALDDLLARCLSRDRDDRYPTAAELLEELARAAPPASAVEVARYVERLCGGSLEQRRAELRALVTAPAPGQARGRRARAALLGAFVIVLTGAAALAIVATAGTPEKHAEQTSRGDVAPSVAPVTPELEASAAVVPPAATASAAGVATASSTRAAHERRPQPTRHPAKAPPAARPGAPAASAPTSPLHGNPYGVGSGAPP
jgi:eukaryotic-like serine/threonine-protein kinase